MVRSFIALIVCISCSTFVLLAQPIKNLRVLYVGGSANWEPAHYKNADEKGADVRQRMNSFEAMLKHYFSDVKAVNATEYTQQMSGQYDVTVFDGTPKPIAGRQMMKDAAGKIINYVPAAYLTEDFDRPVVFIGELGDKLGRNIGLKLDWYCLCLDADALNFKKEHAIFKGPFPVKITVTTKPTPKEAFHYAYYMDQKMPSTIPMWKVQTKGYSTDDNFRIGMVSRPWGFEDSPDAEVISSGVCQKTLDAVAIGRHGNYLQWGFAASPEFMTAEAQTVLANAICYIADFNGKGVIARRYRDVRATHDYLKEQKYLATREAYDSSIAMEKWFAQLMETEKAKAREKQVKGERLSSLEQSALNFQSSPGPSFETFVQRSQKGLYATFGTDAAAYKRYYDSNRNYFYAEDDVYVLSIDEDVKSLRIPYYDQRLLDQSIRLLEKGKDVEKAKRLLARYTLVNFHSPKKWRTWYEQNKTRMFFTESGGYYFMIDTDDKTIPGNDYHTKRTAVLDNIRPIATDPGSPVSLTTATIIKGNDRTDVVIKMRIHPGYHLYANVSEQDPYIPTKINIDLPPGYTKTGELKQPSFHYFSNTGTTIYQDEVIFIQEIAGRGQGEVVCTVQYQCCDSKICFPPELAKKLVIKL